MKYYRFDDAQNFYEGCGYNDIDVPWDVSQTSIEATIPPGCVPVPFLNSKLLVGSAEQSFVELMLLPQSLGKLTPGKYQAVTPCFRDDPEDEIHHKYFMKLELIDYYRNSNVAHVVHHNRLDRILNDAKGFFQKYLKVETLRTDNGIDIIQSKTGIELGSYGYRSFQGHEWVYGTGLAEPRLSYALTKEGR